MDIIIYYNIMERSAFIVVCSKYWCQYQLHIKQVYTVVWYMYVTIIYNSIV